MRLPFLVAIVIWSAACGESPAPTVAPPPAHGVQVTRIDAEGSSHTSYAERVDVDEAGEGVASIRLDALLRSPTDEVYTLRVRSAGHTRLVLDGFVLADAHGDDAVTDATIPLLVDRAVPLVVEIEPEGGRARASLSWFPSSAGDADEALVPTEALVPHDGSPPPPSLGPAWKSVALIVRHTDVALDGPTPPLSTTLTDAEERGAVAAARQLPQLVRAFSDGRGAMELDVIVVDDLTLTHVSPIGDGVWVSPDDARTILDRYTPAGRYDSVFLFWDPDDGPRHLPVCCWYGQGRSRATNDATFASIPNLSDGAWTGPFPAEVLVHEWLHGATAYLRGERGLDVPDPHETATFGHPHADARGSWWEWYRATLAGALVDPVTGAPAGFTDAAWRAGSPTQPVDAAVQAPPAALRIEASVDGVTVSWRAADGADHYRIFRGGKPGTERYFDWTPGTSFIDDELPRKPIACYVVRAVTSSFVESADSARVCVGR